MFRSQSNPLKWLAGSLHTDPQSYDKLAYILYGILFNTYSLNFSFLEIDDVCIGRRISPVGSSKYQCGATAQQVEIASWLYLPVLISFKWHNMAISGPEHNH